MVDMLTEKEKEVKQMGLRMAEQEKEHQNKMDAMTNTFKVQIAYLVSQLKNISDSRDALAKEVKGVEVDQSSLAKKF
jgi:thymidylate synthase